MTAKEDLIEPIMDHGQQPASTTDINDPPPPDYQTSIRNENEIELVENEIKYDENGLPTFPNDDLLKLEEQINRLRWTVPVLMSGELIKCLRAAVYFAREKTDTQHEPCQRFIRDSLVSSFTKIFCDDAVQSWKYDIYECIYTNAMVFIKLCALKLDDDCFPILDNLSVVLSPLNRYHQANHNREPRYLVQSQAEPFAVSNEYRIPQRGWLVDLINSFGDQGGFEKLLTRLTSSENKLTIPLIFALLKPWGLCYEYLTQWTLKKYFAPIIEYVPQFLDQLTESDLKTETKNEAKSDALSAVIKWLRHLAQRLPNSDKACRNLDMLRLKIILRLLQTNSFNGKMNALNEVNKILSNFTSFHRSTLNHSDENEGLTSEKFVQWIREHEILDIVLRDCLHQPQYVEKLEKLLRFIIKEQALTRDDLAKIWNASSGKHEAIEKNVHDLLAKLAWDFSPEQLEQLFDCFRESWTTKASKKQREKLLELIRRLAEDDKEGIMANKVLELLWDISYDKHLPNEIIDQALAAHLKILDYSCLLEKDKTKLAWIDRILEEVKLNKHVLISLKQTREISTQFSQFDYRHNMSRPMNRLSVMNVLETKHNLTRVITENLCTYMDHIRQQREETKKILPPEDYYPDGRFNHNQQIHERLIFLKFILKSGSIYLSPDLLKMIWTSLAEQAVYAQDREQCFRWVAEIIDEVGLDAKAAKDFFQYHLMKLEPHLLTDLGMNCFDRFFKSVNVHSHKLQQKRRSVRLVNDEQLIGIEYLWKVILNGSDEIADRAIQLIKEIYTNISTQLKNEVKRIHQTFLHTCFQRLKQAFDMSKSPARLNGLIRILVVLREYLSECDNSYHKERSVLPMSRASRGRAVVLVVRVNNGQNRQSEDFEHACHSNETWGHIRRMIANRYKATYGVLELYRNNDLIYPTDDNRTLAQTDGRDRIPISIRWVQAPIQMCTSGDSSSSESEMNNNISSTPKTRTSDSIDTNSESLLPSVIFSAKHEYYQFLIEISDLGCHENNPRLRDIPRQILDLVPVDTHVQTFLTNYISPQKSRFEENFNHLKNFYFHSSPTQMLYNLKTTFIKLVPATSSNESRDLELVHIFFLRTGGLTCLLTLLTHKPYTEKFDLTTKKSIYLMLLSALKRFLIILGFYQLKNPNGNDSLEQILNLMPLTAVLNEQQQTTVHLEERIASTLHQHINEVPIPKASFLQYPHIIELIRICWCLASNNKQISFESTFPTIHQSFKQENVRSPDQPDYFEEEDDSILACREGIELLCLSIALVPSSVESLLKESFFDEFLIDLVLYCHYANIRHLASEQILLLTTRCSQGQCERLLKYLIDKQFQILNKPSNNFKIYSSYSSDFFHLLCRLLSFAYVNQILPSNTEQQLRDEIDWLRNLQLPVDDHLLRGHLNLAKELLQFQSTEQKRFYGIDQSLIQQLVEQFLFPASRVLQQVRSSKDNPQLDNELIEPPTPICQSPLTIPAAFDLLVALGTNCIDNLKLIDKYLTDLFYSAPDSNLTEWDFSLPIGSRPTQGFVGLKNAGATCYMNSVVQQLFMIRSLRTALLSVKIPAEYGEDDLDEETFDTVSDVKGPAKEIPVAKDTKQDRSEYNIQILRQIQRIFGHLLESKLQYYIPKGFWKIFKFAGEPVNLREQQDAVEFLNTVVDSVDEALKALNLPQICSKVLGGKFADQKICKDCPHRYSREEDFTLLNVDIRHSQNLKESLEQYVMGELLDGPNAYFCEKCNKKVDTVKRTCFKKLPPILAIQLKRFDYDWERETPIKFNDYFEFPRELDMEPYTVLGLAKAEGTPVIDENTTDDQTTTTNNSNESTRYKLVGVIVHMGQANGGHYYSFIQNKTDCDAPYNTQWYKFDDTDVSECKMDDDEELRSQCFGGDQPTSTFDPPPMKRQRRWWNGYILFYEKISLDETKSVTNLEHELLDLQLYDQTQRMPLAVQRSVRKQNIKFYHNRILFNVDYFNFIKKLVQCNVHHLVSTIQQQQPYEEKVSFTNGIEELALLCVQIATKLLFSVGWHSKKALRGTASDWTELMSHCIRHSRQARHYVAEEVLFKHPNRFQEYLLDSTSAEIRGAFSRLLVVVAKNYHQDEPTIDRESTEVSIEENILNNVLRLLTKDVPDNAKIYTQYFQFFINYSIQGRHECEQLIRHEVPILFADLTINDASSSSLSRYGESSKLFITLSTLIRCFDVSSHCKPCQSGQSQLPNPYYTYGNDPICCIPEKMSTMVYVWERLLKKIIEDAISSEESLRLLQFLLWENPEVTSSVINVIMGLLSMYYTCDLRTHLDVLYQILIIDDSWQEYRLSKVLKSLSKDEEASSTSDENIYARDSLFDLFTKSNTSNQKRAYQFVKMLLQLFSSCPQASNLLHNDQDIKRRWSEVVRWLHDQLERPNSIPSNYSYYPSQGQISNNDLSQGFYLERTASAKSVLEKAAELCSDKENGDTGSTSDEMEEEDPIDHRLPPTVRPEEQVSALLESSCYPHRRIIRTIDPDTNTTTLSD